MDPSGPCVRPVPSSFRRALCVLAVFVALGAAPAASAEEDGVATEGGLGIGSTVCTLVYAPIKIVYAVGGTVVSGLAYLWTWGDTDVAGPIYEVAIKGDYVVTPDHLRGDDDLVFAGEYR